MATPSSSSSFQSTLERIDSLRESVKSRIESPEATRARRRLEEAVLRGALTGLSLRGGLHAATFLFETFLRSRRKTNQSIKQGGRPSGIRLVEDTIRWGLFLGSFSGTVVAVDELISMVWGSKKTSSWRGLVSGAVAGPTLLLTGRKSSHTGLAVFVLVRGLTLLVRCGNLPSADAWKRRLLAPTRFRHGDVVLMCICSGQLLWSWIVMPSALAPSFVRFLNKHCGKDVAYVAAVREMCQNSARGIRNSPLQALQRSTFKNFRGELPCEFLHPGLNCAQHTIAFLPEAYYRALRVYVPVYIIPAALVHRKRLIGNLRLWYKIAFGTARSSLFLALYCTLAWTGACAGWQLSGRTTSALIAASCWVSGLATLAEKKSRRMELALYCLSRAVESLGLVVVAQGLIPQRYIPKRMDVILFSIASAAIIHCFSDHCGARREVFRSKYLEVFDFILGNEGFAHGCIVHSPSNAELMSMAGKRLARSFQSMTSLASMRQRSSDSKDLETVSMDDSDGSIPTENADPDSNDGEFDDVP